MTGIVVANVVRQLLTSDNIVDVQRSGHMPRFEVGEVVRARRGSWSCEAEVRAVRERDDGTVVYTMARRKRRALA